MADRNGGGGGGGGGAYNASGYGAGLQGERAAGAAVTGRRTTKMRLDDLKNQLRAKGSKIMKTVMQILSLIFRKLRRIVVAMVDRLFPPNFPSEEGRGGDGNGARHGHGPDHGDGDGDHSDGITSPRSPSDSRPSTANNREEWRRWFYHVVTYLIYPYVNRIVKNLLTRLKSLDPDP